MGKLSDRMNRAGVIAFCLLLMIGGLSLTMAVSLLIKIIGLALFTFGFFGGHSVASSWVGLLANRREKAQASSLYLLFYYVGSSIVGSTGGLFLQRFGWNGVVAAIVVLCLAGVVVSLLVYRMVLHGDYRRHHSHHHVIGQHI